jgi:hypothetical protein
MSRVVITAAAAAAVIAALLLYETPAPPVEGGWYVAGPGVYTVLPDRVEGSACMLYNPKGAPTLFFAPRGWDVVLGEYRYKGVSYIAVRGRGYWAKHPAYVQLQEEYPGYEIRFNAPADIELGQPHNELGKVWIYYPPGSFTQEPGFYGWLSYYIDYIQIVYGHAGVYYLAKYEGVNKYYRSFYVKRPRYSIGTYQAMGTNTIVVMAWMLYSYSDGFVDVYIADPSIAEGEPIGFAGDCRLYFSQQKAALLQRGVGVWP